MALHPDYFAKSGHHILTLAHRIATQAGHETIETDHILLAMTRSPQTNAYHALQDVDIIDGKLARYLRVLHPPKKGHPLRFEGAQIADEIQVLFNLSMTEAKLRGEDYIASAHLLIGLMRLQSETVAAILEHFALEPKDVIKATEYYFEYSVEAQKVRISVEQASYEENVGCVAALSEIFYELTRKRKNDE